MAAGKALPRRRNAEGENPHVRRRKWSSTLVLLSDAPGVVIGGKIVSRLAPADLSRAIEHPDVRDGMVEKLRSGAKAIGAGVARVRIAAWNGPGTLRALLGDGEGGTTLHGHEESGKSHD